MKRPDSFTDAVPIIGADAIQSMSCADALRRREKPVVLFTPALLFTHAGFDRDPVIEFDARFPAESRDLRPFCLDLKGDDVFFRGMGIMPPPGRATPVNWNQRLYCIDASRKEECFGFLSGIAFSCPKTQFFASTFYYELPVPDPTSKVLEFLNVAVFGVLTNKGVVFLAGDYNAPPFVRALDLNTARIEIPNAIKSAELFGGFTEEDPLTMRDE
jgi:hypothetical protein